MLNIEEAQELILRNIRLLGSEQLHVTEALGRVACSDIFAPKDIPNADLSAMDGFCFSSSSVLDRRLAVVDFLPAGKERRASILTGEAVKIMTGAPVPAGCDTVIPIEDVEESGAGILLKKDLPIGANIRSKGDDVKANECILGAGSVLSPQAIGLLVSIGMITVPVFRKPRIAIIATGDEVTPLGSTLSPGQVINSNSYSIAALVEAAGGIPVVLGIARDNLEATCAMLNRGLDADLIVTTGGASVGDRDYVKDAIISLGGEIKFWKVSMKPGKPVAFGSLRDVPVFALPGNPVSAMVGFELFVRPALLKMSGLNNVYRVGINAVMTEPLSNPGDRTLIVSVRMSIDDKGVLVAKPEKQSSTCLLAMTRSNGFVKLSPGTVLEPGNVVLVYLAGRIDLVMDS